MKPVDYEAERRYRIYHCIDHNAGWHLGDSFALRVANALAVAEFKFHPTFTTSDSAMPVDQPFHNGGIDHFVSIGTQDPDADLDLIEQAFAKAAAANAVEIKRVGEGLWVFKDGKWASFKDLRVVR